MRFLRLRGIPHSIVGDQRRFLSNLNGTGQKARQASIWTHSPTVVSYLVVVITYRAGEKSADFQQ